ncbi:MAG: radical SAM protein [Bacteroidetes bacterium]|nr:radical SAM protein [Bacteroidota bacterium]
MRILLISPGSPGEIDNKIIREIPYLLSKAFIAPHAVATIAALTPREHEVEIHDEYVRGPINQLLIGKEYDIIGISFTSNQLLRSLEIAKACKKYCPNSTIVAGGIGVEMLIHKNKENIDVVFHGEAEETWPRFLEDFKKGEFQLVYKNITKPDMKKAPPPRWELIKDDIHLYNSVSVQTTRGCPFDCSFCDVIYTYGRKPRSKTIDQVLDEINRLNDLKVHMVFIADDNFAGDKKYVKELLQRLIVLNNSFKVPISFYTQLDITIANDDELLKLLADANFTVLMIGIESINPDSLKDMNKKQNINISIPDSIKKIQSYGMVVLAHMIIGADSDTKETFKQNAAFIQENNIIFHICHPLAAPPGTKMWYDYKRQGRLVKIENPDANDKVDILSNIIPKQITRIELFEGMADYWDEIYQPEKFAERAIGFLKGITYKPKVKYSKIYLFWHMRKIMGKVMSFYFFKAERMHRKNILRIMQPFKKNIGHMMQKIIFIYTFYIIDYKRSAYDALEARKMADWERNHPQMIKVDSCIVPISENIRKNATELIEKTFDLVREKTSNQEIINKVVLNTILDFSDRFGETFEHLDAFHKEQLKESFESVFNQIDEKIIFSSEFLEKQPSGFTREIMDALDNTVRYRNVYG